MTTEDNEIPRVSLGEHNVNDVADRKAADIVALYDHLTLPQKAWFLEQLRRGARGEPNFLDDPKNHTFEAWSKQPAGLHVAEEERDSILFDVSDRLCNARKRTAALRSAITGHRPDIDRDAWDGMIFWTDDIVDIIKDAEQTLDALRQEGGAV